MFSLSASRRSPSGLMPVKTRPTCGTSDVEPWSNASDRERATGVRRETPFSSVIITQTSDDVMVGVAPFPLLWASDILKVFWHFSFVQHPIKVRSASWVYLGINTQVNEALQRTSPRHSQLQPSPDGVCRVPLNMYRLTYNI